MEEKVKVQKPRETKAEKIARLAEAVNPLAGAEPVVVVKEKAIKTEPVCGHKTIHGLELTCELEPGHVGNHKAKYAFRDETKVAEWSDGSGTPQAEIVTEHNTAVQAEADKKQA